MKVLLLFAAFGLISCEPEDSYCCKPGQGVMADNENLCVDTANNVTFPTKLSCDVVYHFNQSEYKFLVTDDGRLIMLFALEAQVEADQFCIANRTLNSNERSAVVCDEVEEVIFDQRILGYCMLVSAVFLTLTAIVYCALPEMRDLQGKSIINFCGSLALGLSILGVVTLNLPYSDMGLCAARGFFIYFFIIASFFWTNAISIQILINLRAIIDAFNVLQGFLIFMLLVAFRKRVLKAMFKRGWLNCISGTVERHLAVGDDEEEVVNHTIEVGLHERLTK
ncbi:jg20352 [Pararge aegeria aegeria]|uniref:Jg20352 protein n=1 Tax=Pararge aegeria aegeria TaxID=348720 RepID=A0A8S4R9Y6_9NEOP|nr:jg20352 [Pararge aegeria aegeria]